MSSLSTTGRQLSTNIRDNADNGSHPSNSLIVQSAYWDCLSYCLVLDTSSSIFTMIYINNINILKIHSGKVFVGPFNSEKALVSNYNVDLFFVLLISKLENPSIVLLASQTLWIWIGYIIIRWDPKKQSVLCVTVLYKKCWRRHIRYM